jgi:hypothetical protein
MGYVCDRCCDYEGYLASTRLAPYFLNGYIQFVCILVYVSANRASEKRALAHLYDGDGLDRVAQSITQEPKVGVQESTRQCDIANFTIVTRNGRRSVLLVAA